MNVGRFWSLDINRLYSVVFVLLAVSGLTVGYAFAPPGNPTCYENLTGDYCNLLNQPFNAILTPYSDFLGPFFPLLFWGPVMAILWIRNANPILTGIIGLVVASTVTGITNQQLAIGWSLIGLTIGITLFRLIKLRLDNPQ